MSRAVFLDRDGVINRAVVREGKPYPPATVGELEILPGVPEALARLKAAGYWLVVVTNQPDVARGTQSRAEVEAMHVRLARQLPIDDFEVCYHDNHDACECRKPRPGMLLAAARKYSLDLAECYLVGDRWRDIEAGRAAGCRTIYIDYGYAEPTAQQEDCRVGTLGDAADWILHAHGDSNEGHHSTDH